MLSEFLENVRKTGPLVHCITNYVTANDTANFLLAVGALPVMADDAGEVEEITAAARALVLNIGVPSDKKIKAMIASGKTARRHSIPIVLDPVGVGASAMRREAVRQIIEETSPDVIRGNFSEIYSICEGVMSGRGVDTAISPRKVSEAVYCAEKLSELTGSTVVISGESDVVTYSGRTWIVRNGDALMKKITGMGCSLSALIAAFSGAVPERTCEAALAAACAMGVFAERARKRMGKDDGSAAMRSYIIDAASVLTPDELEREAVYEVL